MKSDHQEDLDIQQDVNTFKRIWKEKEELDKKLHKQFLKKSQAATQTKSLNQTKTNISKDKKSKVIISQQNMKNTIRNPKSKAGQVIEVKTNPIIISTDKIKNQRNNTAPQHFILTNPQQQILKETQLYKRNIADKDYQLSLLRVSNSHNQDKIRRLEQTIIKKDQMIQQLRNNQRQLTNKLSQLNIKDINFNYGKVEYQNYRHDSRRLLKLLKTTNQYSNFAEFALDDNGIRFLTNLNNNIKTKLDDLSKNRTHDHKHTVPQDWLWVPQKAYDFGKQFIKDRAGQVSQAQLELLLYELNKIWRQRQKRIVNHVNALKANEVGKYKRKMNDITIQRSKKTLQKEHIGAIQ